MEKRLEITAADFAKWHNDALSHTNDVVAIAKQATVEAEPPATNPPLKSIAISATGMDRRKRR